MEEFSEQREIPEAVPSLCLDWMCCIYVCRYAVCSVPLFPRVDYYVRKVRITRSSRL
jgi:hypothetical protein